jgi:hypothetical protein
MPRFATILVLCSLCFILQGCPQQPVGQSTIKSPLLQSVDLSDPTDAVVTNQPIALSGAGNEYLDFVVQIQPGTMPISQSLRIALPQIGAGRSITASTFRILSVPVDLNRADFIRATSRLIMNRQIPRVLLPLPTVDGSADLRLLQNVDGPILIWIELYIPPGATAGDYKTSCDLIEHGNPQPIASLPMELTISDFSLPPSPGLQLVGRLDWQSLQHLYPSEFERVTPRLLNRRDPASAAPIHILDQLIELARDNGAVAFIPELQPTVKWEPGNSPNIDWSDFDSLVSPWLDGPGGLGYWALPTPEFLDHFDLDSQAQYWKIAANHFKSKGWLKRAPLVLSNESDSPPNSAQAIVLSTLANRILAANPTFRVQVPLDDQQILSGPIDPKTVNRLLALAPGPLSPATLPSSNTNESPHWLCPYRQEATSEFDIRAFGWSAFLGNASLFESNAPVIEDVSPDHPADPSDMIWFYPGQSFGRDEPLPTIQLKWLRKAQQDFQYLRVAQKLSDDASAQRMARSLIKPVQLQTDQQSDPTLNLFAGTPDRLAWVQARQILADRISHHTSATTDSTAADLAFARWLQSQQQPAVLPHSVTWKWNQDSSNTMGNWLIATVNLDAYNPSEELSTNNQIQWTTLTAGWLARPEPVDTAPVPSFGVARLSTDARFNLDQISPASRKPLQLTFIDGYSNTSIPCSIALPVAASERRIKSLSIDGSLDDWSAADAIQLDQPLVRMLNRASVQHHELQPATLPASIFTAWSDDNLYIAFRLSGVSALDLSSTHNFVDYQNRRAWGEDLCEILIQPIDIDNTLGPVLHVVCKPSGPWVERKELGPAQNWQPFEGSSVRYASTVDPATRIWRGEIAIPWKAINAESHGRPSLLRFNFSQHQNATGESASWAGPIDFGRDDQMMGLIHLRESTAPRIATLHQ